MIRKGTGRANSQPGDPDYSPLRQEVLVSWADESQAKELTSEDEITALVNQGALTLEETNIVVNMPFMTWKVGSGNAQGKTMRITFTIPNMVCPACVIHLEELEDE